MAARGRFFTAGPGGGCTIQKIHQFLDLVNIDKTDLGRRKILLFSTIIRRNCEVKVTEKYLIYMWRFEVAIFFNCGFGYILNQNLTFDRRNC